MNNIIYFVAIAMCISGLIPNNVYAATAYVRILDKNLNTICDTQFTGTIGMDSITQTAGECGFSYSLGFGGDFLDEINGAGWDGTNWWVLYVDGMYANKGVNEYNLEDVTDIWWVFNDGSYTPPSIVRQKLMSTAGEGIVGLINPTTRGLPDFDGDGINDVDERNAGTNPTIPEEYSSNTQVAGVADGVGVNIDGVLTDIVQLLTGIFIRLQTITEKYETDN